MSVQAELFTRHYWAVTAVIEKRLGRVTLDSPESIQEAWANAIAWSWDHWYRHWRIDLSDEQLLELATAAGCLGRRRCYVRTYGAGHKRDTTEARAPQWQAFPDEYLDHRAINTLAHRIADLPDDLIPIAEQVVYGGLTSLRLIDAERLPEIREQIEVWAQ